MRRYFTIPIILFAAYFFNSCESSEDANTLFQLQPSSSSGIDFVNKLEFNRDFNIYRYRNFYNGGGVALGDINNDGLLDVYFTANQKKNKLYLNNGEFKFEDVSSKAGVEGNRAWSTGVAMADVNADGWLDIYVCNSGDVKGDNKQNELFINNGDGTFIEKAEEYGLADRGFSTHGVFFDYDKDGDLDMYLLNNSYQAIGSFNLRKNERPKRDAVGGDKLFRNDQGKFIDVSEEAGIYGSIIGFGLGVTIGDVNRDGWLDIYVSNDFFERDYLYINQKDGTFDETLTKSMNGISSASMGADMADINNDGYSEIFVTEMLPEYEDRQKTVTTFESWDRYQYNVMNDYWHQFTRNTLQYNNTDGSFSDISRFAGVAATDWSWGALIFDMDNDGWKDIFVANGIYQDLTNQDYLNFVSNEETRKSMITEEGVNYKKLVEIIPSNRIPNYAFLNNADLTFKNAAEQIGLATPSHSNGSSYGDLDNDGDMDLVVNNVNMTSFIYKNTSREKNRGNYLQFQIRGAGKNTFAIGTKISVFADGKMFYTENMPMKGFQSSTDPRPLIGLCSTAKVDSILIEWPDMKLSKLEQLDANQVIELDESSIEKYIPTGVNVAEVPLFTETNDMDFDFKHAENNMVDFDRERLIFHMRSTTGPKMAVGDVNADGLQDVYFCNAKNTAGGLYIQNGNGELVPQQQKFFEYTYYSEEVDAQFFDADGDGDLDLYVAVGGNEVNSSQEPIYDKLYLNDGTGNFELQQIPFPVRLPENSSCIRPEDFDNDGDVDLFVGVASKVDNYGIPTSSYLLENTGNGRFSNATKSLVPDLINIGMVCDARWADLNQDGFKDLIVSGEWMSVKAFLYDAATKQFVDKSEEMGLSDKLGWWYTIEIADVNNDGFPDIIGGNLGLNTFIKGTKEKPASLYVNDFDSNGTIEQILAVYFDDKDYPLVLRHDLVMQMPELKKKYLKYEAYKTQQVTDIFTEEQLSGTIKYTANCFESTLFMNNGGYTFESKALPWQAQLSTVHSILAYDADQDGNLDLLVGGNLYNVKPQIGRYDASYGLFLQGDGTGNFTALSSRESGIKISGQIRDFELIKTQKGDRILVARNNDNVVKLKVSR